MNSFTALSFPCIHFSAHLNLQIILSADLRRTRAKYAVQHFEIVFNGILKCANVLGLFKFDSRKKVFGFLLLLFFLECCISYKVPVPSRQVSIPCKQAQRVWTTAQPWTTRTSAHRLKDVVTAGRPVPVRSARMGKGGKSSRQTVSLLTTQKNCCLVFALSSS